MLNFNFPKLSFRGVVSGKVGRCVFTTNTITDGGNTATHSKAKSLRDGQDSTKKASPHRPPCGAFKYFAVEFNLSRWRSISATTRMCGGEGIGRYMRTILAWWLPGFEWNLKHEKRDLSALSLKLKPKNPASFLPSCISQSSPYFAYLASVWLENC